MEKFPIRKPGNPGIPGRFTFLASTHCTFKCADPLTPFRLAPTVADPTPVEVAIPALLMIATFELAVVQSTKMTSHTNALSSPSSCTRYAGSEVRFCVVPSSKWPNAVKACVPPRLMVGLAGATSIETKCALLTTRLVVPTTPLR